MPMSKEVGVDLHGRRSADSFVDLPIKKRKYHIVRSPSPPPTSSLLPKEPNLLRKDESISEIETPVSGIAVDCNGYSFFNGRISADRNVNLSNEISTSHMVGSPSPPPTSSLIPKEPNLLQKDEPISEIETSVSGIAVDCNENSLFNGRISADRNVNLSNEISSSLELQNSDDKCTSLMAELGCKGKLIPEEELTFQQVAIDSGLSFSQKEHFQHPIGNEINEEKPISSTKSANRGVSGNNELLSSLKEPFQHPIRKEINEVKPIMSTKYVCGEVTGNNKLLSSLREPLGLLIECQNFGGSYPKHEKLRQSPAECSFDIYPGNLRDPSLFEEKVNVLQTKGDFTLSNVESTHLPESRSQWDLNTAMDTWEDSVSNISVNYTSHVTNGLDIKPEVFSKELVTGDPENSHVTSTKCAHVECKWSFDLLSCFNRELCPPNELTKVKVDSDLSKLEKVTPPANMKFISSNSVKPEKIDSGEQGDLRKEENQCRLTHLRTPKSEVSDAISQEDLRTARRKQLVNPTGIKSEPVDESRAGMPGEGISHFAEIHMLMPEKTIKALDLVTGSAVPDVTKEVLADSVLDAAQMSGFSSSAAISTDELSLHSSVIKEKNENGDGEKVNISANIHEDDSYDSKHEIGGSSNVDMVVGQANDNGNGEHFDDGEVGEPLLHETAVDDVHEEGKMGMGSVSCCNPGSKEVHSSGDPGSDGVLISSHVDSKTGNPKETLRSTGENRRNLSFESKKGSRTPVPCLKKSSVSAVSAAGSGKRRIMKVIKKTPHGCSGQKENGLKGFETNSNQGPSAGTSHETVTSYETVADDSKDKTVCKQDSLEDLPDLGKVSHLKFPKCDTSTRDDEGTKSNQTRIISLAQTCNGPSTGSTRSGPVVPLALPSERGRFPHTSYRAGQLNPQGSRYGRYMDGHHKFGRDRNMNQSTINSGPDFLHMEGWVDDTLDARRDSDCEFSPRHYSGSNGARFLRGKNIMAVDAAKHKGNGVVIAPDGSVVNPGRSWRRPMHDKSDGFPRLPFERGSPVGRKGHMPLCLQMARRPHRVISPDRCISEGDHDMVLVRREGKLVRDFPDEMIDPLRPPSRFQYQRAYNSFIRRKRSFMPVEMHDSVSPPRSRSPCSWPSPGRSPDRLDEHPELFVHGPPVFREKGMRSPHQRPCFTDAMAERRHGSPIIQQLSDEMRKMGPLKKHGRQRPFILNRSPSGRILQRIGGGFDMIDSRDRLEGDEYFGPMHSDQFHGHVVDGYVSDRRKCRERFRTVHSFEPNEVGDVERFHHLDNSPRPYKFHSGADAEFNEKGLRGCERDFKARVNTRLGNPRRLRSVDEHRDDESFHCEKWGEVNFSDTVGLKRGRF